MPVNYSGVGRSGEELRRARRQQVRPGFAGGKLGLDLRQNGRGRGRAPGEPTRRDLASGAVAASRQQQGLARPVGCTGGSGGGTPSSPFSPLPRLSGESVPLAATIHAAAPIRTRPKWHSSGFYKFVNTAVYSVVSLLHLISNAESLDAFYDKRLIN